jgi:hypothetical protein
MIYSQVYCLRCTEISSSSGRCEHHTNVCILQSGCTEFKAFFQELLRCSLIDLNLTILGASSSRNLKSTNSKQVEQIAFTQRGKWQLCNWSDLGRSLEVIASKGQSLATPHELHLFLRGLLCCVVYEDEIADMSYIDLSVNGVPKHLWDYVWP